MQRRKKEHDKHLTTLKTIDLNRLVSNKRHMLKRFVSFMRFALIMCKMAFMDVSLSDAMNNICGCTFIVVSPFFSALAREIC